MPEYTFKCTGEGCGVFTRQLSMAERGVLQACPVCLGGSEKIVGGSVGTVLRGDVWFGKNLTIKRQMAERRERVGRRERELSKDGPQFKLVPNVGGERVDSWQDAAKLAASKGKDTSGYTQRIGTEK